jgi:hypothetical protein
VRQVVTEGRVSGIDYSTEDAHDFHRPCKDDQYRPMLAHLNPSLPYYPRLATIQGAGVAFPGAGISRCSDRQVRET